MSYWMDEDFSASGNTNGWRSGNLKGFIIHHSAGTTIDMAGTFLNHSTSAHYGIQGDHVRQFVEDGKTVWATGTNDGNNNYISIECVNSGGESAGWPVSEETVDTLVEFLADKCREHGFSYLANGDNLFGHRDFYSTFCPGVLYDRLDEIANRVNNNLNGEEDDVSADDVWNFNQNGTLMRDRIQGTDEAANGANEAASEAKNQLTRTDDVSGRGTEANMYERICWMGARTAELEQQIDDIAKIVDKIAEKVGA